MTDREVSISALLNKLADGWSASHRSLLDEVILRWEKRFDTRVQVKDIDENICNFVTYLSKIRLRGMYRLPCLIVGGKTSDLTPAVKKFWEKVKCPGRIPFVLTLSDIAYQQALYVVPRSDCLLLPPDQVLSLLDSADPQDTLKAYLRQQIPIRRLNPYTILHSTDGNMFFGRSKELDRLRYEKDVSFAIAGPSRIGKTSLLKQYNREMIREGDSRVAHIREVDFHDCQDRTPNGVARFFAMEINPSNRSNRMTAEGLVNFLKYQRSEHGHRLELLLDEVDEVCQGGAFNCLGKAAKEGICRLILSGRGSLLKMALSSHSPIGHRLDLIRPEPLDTESAKKLILEPLMDLGFRVIGVDQIIHDVFHLTGRLPHLLQSYGNKLVDIALVEGTDTISIEHIDRLKWDFEFAQYLTSPLQDIVDPKGRLLALSLLKESHRDFDIPSIQKFAEGLGFNLDYQKTKEMCNDLVIHNILAWNQGLYRIATGALSYYAREMRFLDDAIDKARHAIKTCPDSGM
ncbi:MAG: hypothetical protein A3G93_00460 [Nitrospinae bacterium RIFCSPLOWO2_12_FULL_45_22]|nr:MAG: hypothetical protein A3G93_00460 [Nitrospinae bacterium RIFCSPLOWO2_12_FULL_45_22]